MKNILKANQNSKFSLSQDGHFIIEDYNHIDPFSNFFPGIAGLWGIPMWVFYVNRGQGISSFGIESKDKSILEFHSANKAYQLTSTHGFRTFLKIKTGSRTVFCEPFQPREQKAQRMMISSYDLTLEEIILPGLMLRVNYFTLPEEPYAALVRRVILENATSQHVDIEMVDGLPSIVSFGLTDWLLKHMSRTVEAWVMVRNLKKQAPYFRLKVEVQDKPAVTHIKEGNFYFAFSSQQNQVRLLQPLVDAQSVFGSSQDFIVPERFWEGKKFIVPNKQQTSNRTPCAMSFEKFTLKSFSKRETTSLIGYANEEATVNRIVTQAMHKGFIDRKAQRNKEIIGEVQRYALTNSSSSELNHYITQSFLDNVLRGGLPVSLETKEGKIAFNVYSRKHGDLERDYNFFVLAPTFFSQGNGNYRDVNQNRRNDVWFNSDVKDQQVINFLNLIQADGYNPLIVKGLTLSIDDPHKVDEISKEYVREESYQPVKNLLTNGFQPGELLKKISQNEIKLIKPLQEFFSKVISICHKNEAADHGEGYWSDHWTYNLDLIESYLAVYPEELRHLLLEKNVFTFYFDSFYILPQNHRYILTANGVRQYHSVFDASKEIKAKAKGNKLRVKGGEGHIYHTTLIVKLLSLVANKAASLDPSGIGIEMEADKPNWYDALNGLPGLLGSSICESFELKRLCLFILKSFHTVGVEDHKKIRIFQELASFISGLTNLLAVDFDPASHKNEDNKSTDEDQINSSCVAFWLKSNDSKEHYRQRIRYGISGEETEISIAEIKKFLNLVVEKTGEGIRKALDRQELYATYFTHEVTHYNILDKAHQGNITEGIGHPVKDNQEHESTYVKPVSFKRHALPLFLEGFVHALRVENNKEAARKIYLMVKKSLLLDKKLKMYKVNTDLSHESEEIGRTRIFPPGWLENESIWLHMEYKYLLEILRCGLYEEFYEELKNCFIPFQSSQKYGRSILENSSFIVSSAHEDQSLHGRGFVARLSGSTAELVHMWLIMNVGQNPFGLDQEKKLTLAFRPVLPAWLFTTQETAMEWNDIREKVALPANTYAFNFLGKILVVYHNPRRKNTFGQQKASIKSIRLTYPDRKKQIDLDQPVIGFPHAQQIRNREVERIDVFFE